MNNKQKAAFLLGTIIIALMGLCPPWKEAGPNGLPLQYGPVFAPPRPLKPEKGMEIDVVRLLLQVGVAAVLSAGLMAAGAPAPVAEPGGAGGAGGAGGLSGTAGGSQKASDSGASGSIASTARLQDLSTKEDEGEEDDEEVDDDDEDDEDDAEEEASVTNEEDSPASDDGSSHVIRLPGSKSYGEFLVESEDDPEYWETLSDARGLIRLPKNKRVQLEVKGNKDVDLSFITVLTPESLHSIDLSESKVRDWELGNLQKLSGLRELDLSGTGITSQALSYLIGLDKLEKLWLDETAIDDSCIADLRRFISLKKLSIKNTKLTADGIREIKERLPECTVESD